MFSHTPKFDAALDKILGSFSPRENECVTCKSKFEIEPQEIDLINSIHVPPPKECSVCRMRKRMAMMANIFKFYKKECSAHPGEGVVSQMDDNAPYKIYDNNFWWDPDAWDGTKFGKAYDPTTSFEEQLERLLYEVPHMAIERFNKNIINSEYTVDSLDVKNCYLSSTIAMSEDTAYALWAVYTKDCFDVLRTNHVEHSYEIIDSDHIYKCSYIQNSNNCTDSQFLFDCHNCQYCFGCVNLRNKKYRFYNEQLSREEYEDKISKINPGDRTVVAELRGRFDDIVKQRGIFRFLQEKNSPNATGNYIYDCKNCADVFCVESFKFLLTFYKNENVRHSQDILGTKDCMDVTIFGPGERCYNTIEGLSVNKVIASYFIENSMEMEYCFECTDCKYCFGCTGLKKKKFHILNKQYREDEYWTLVDEIKTKMLNVGTYGMFLPLSQSFFYYQDTYANAMLPLDESSAAKLGARWRREEKSVDIQGLQLLRSRDTPKDIKDVNDDILEKAIVCDETGRPFRITKLELDFYRRCSIPIPTLHPQTRLLKRFEKRNPYQLWDSHCTNCGAAIRTSYDPTRKLRVYCEQCYQAEVI